MRNQQALETYRDLLLQWQKTINLVSPSTLNDAWDRHIVDSAQMVDYIPSQVKKICDIGSGAGFPGLVLAIECPDIDVHLVESDVRKCAFLRTVSRETLCENVTVHTNRIEGVIGDIDADLITARALASLNDLVTYAQPLWANNPALQMLLLKGEKFQAEINDARQNYDFDCEVFSSQTNSLAKILLVGNIAQK